MTGRRRPTMVCLEPRRVDHVVSVRDRNPNVILFPSVTNVPWVVPLNPSSMNSDLREYRMSFPKISTSPSPMSVTVFSYVPPSDPFHRVWTPGWMNPPPPFS